MRDCPVCHDHTLSDSHLFCGNCGAYVGKYVPTLEWFGGPAGVVLRHDGAHQPGGNLTFQVATTGTSGRVLEKELHSFERLRDTAPDATTCSDACRWAINANLGPIQVGVFIYAGRESKRLVPVPQAGTLTFRHPPPNFIAELGKLGGIDTLDIRAIPDRPDWRLLSIPVRNIGGSAIIMNARLRVQRCPGSDIELDIWDAQKGLVAEGGKVTHVLAALTAIEAEFIANSNVDIFGTLELAIDTDQSVETSGGVALAKAFTIGPVKLGRQRSARPVLTVRDNNILPRPKIRQGRRGRIAIAFQNSGSGHFLIDTVSVSIATIIGQERDLETPMPIGLHEPIEGGRTKLFELRPLVPAQTRVSELEALKIIATGRTDTGKRFTLSQSLLVSIEKANAKLRGLVCIDFGTSESAAAVLLEPSGDQGERLLVIELGNIPVNETSPTPQEVSARFLPTLVVRLEDENRFLAGYDVSAILHARDEMIAGRPRPQRVPAASILQDFKLRLSGRYPLEVQEEATHAAAAFLKHVKELIEDHPAIAAEIADDTEVVATRPRQWEDGQTVRLEQAFLSAGLGTPTIRINGSHETLLPESWPPIKFALYGTTNPAGKERFAVLEPSGGLFSQPFDPKETRLTDDGYLLIADIGAGTGDYSLIKLSVNYPTEVIKEVAFDTDLTFVGRQFEAFIGDALSSWAYEYWQGLGGRGLSKDVFKRHLGAQLNSDAPSRSAFQAAVKAIQYQPGLFHTNVGSNSNKVLGSFTRYIKATMNWDDQVADVDTTHKLVQEWYNKDGPLRATAIGLLPLQLGVIPNGPQVSLELDGSWDAFAATLIERFIEKFADDLKARISKVFKKANFDFETELAGSSRHRRSIRSGRGGAFPLADILLSVTLEHLVGPAWLSAVVPPAASKSITSWGGAWLAPKLANPEDTDLRFEWGEQADGIPDKSTGSNTANKGQWPNQFIPYMRWNPKAPFGMKPFAKSTRGNWVIINLLPVFRDAPGLMRAPTRNIILSEGGKPYLFHAPTTIQLAEGQGYSLRMMIGDDGQPMLENGFPILYEGLDFYIDNGHFDPTNRTKLTPFG